MEYRPLAMRIIQTIVQARYTKTIFKKVDIELSRSKVRAALLHVARTKKTDAYECLVDFLYAELFNDQYGCRAYYSGKSTKKLRDRLTDDQIDECEAFMLDCLELAVVLHERDLADDWNEKTDLYVWNIWHKQFGTSFKKRGGRTWTAFRSLALHLKKEFSKK